MSAPFGSRHRSSPPISHHAFAGVARHAVGELAREGSEARAATKAGLALDPGFTIRRLQGNPASNHPTYLAKRERVYEGMRLATVGEVMSAAGHFRRIQRGLSAS